MKIKIEKMIIDDLENIKDVLISDFDDFWNYNVLKTELLNETSYYIVAKNPENIIVGFAGVQFILDEASITNIVARKIYRHQGIGTLLLKNIILISKQKNMSSITLEVNENNSYALSLYNKLGFEKIGLRKKYYNGVDNAIIMRLSMVPG